MKSLIERSFTLVINPVVFSETAYKVMFTLALRDGLKGVYDLRKHLDRYAWVYGKVKKSIELLIKNELLRIVEVNAEIGEKYALLTNDAIIVATCKYYEIQKIATFDEDFKKVDFIEIIDSSL
nr:PIN domain-containing protein [Pyrococcus horikoshii]